MIRVEEAMGGVGENTAIPIKKMKAIAYSLEKSAKAIDLVYVQDNQPGISRIRKSDGFHYFIGKRKLRNKATLRRIESLVIPPAWENVWICAVENGHLQATGIDQKQRKQYKYHSSWTALRNQTKFFHLCEFGKALPAIRQQLAVDLALPGMPVEKVLAAVVCLMEQTSIRIGSGQYEKLYGSFGLTTLKDHHAKISGDKLQFVFTGKKGIAHNISITSKRLARIVKSCRDIPGKQLFQYYDSEGKRHAIDSGMVNAYLKAIAGQEFTAKDFRTWAGTLCALKAFSELGPGDSDTEIKKNIVTALDRVAQHLGNTRTVCRKYYVHPALIELYEKRNLHTYLAGLEKNKTGLEKGTDAEEELLLAILTTARSKF